MGIAYFLAKIVACSKRVVSGGTPEVRQRYAGSTRAVEPEVDQRYARVTGEYPMLWIHNLIPPNFKTTPKDNREKRRRIRNEVKPFWQAIKPKNRNFGNNFFIHASIQSCRLILQNAIVFVCFVGFNLSFHPPAPSGCNQNQKTENQGDQANKKTKVLKLSARLESLGP